MDARLGLVGLLVGASCAVGGSLGCGREALDSDTFKIGVLLPYTGGAAATGRNNERAILMALERVAQSGVAGKSVELIYGDTASSPDRAEEALTTMLLQHPRAVIGPKEDDVAASLFQRLADEEVLLVSADVLSSVAQASRPDATWFRLAPTTQAEAEALAKAVLDRGVPGVTLVLSTDTSSLEFGAAFSSRFRELGGTILRQVFLPVQQLSYARELAVLPEDAPNHLLLAAPTATAARVVNELGARIPEAFLHLYLTPELRSEVFVQSSLGATLEGSLGVSPFVFPGSDAFVRAFEEHWKGDVPMTSSLFYFDALVLVAMALEQAHVGSATPTFQDLASSLRQVATPPGVLRGWTEIGETLSDLRAGGDFFYSGVTGPFVFDGEGARQSAASAFWTVQDGAIVDVP